MVRPRSRPEDAYRQALFHSRLESLLLSLRGRTVILVALLVVVPFAAISTALPAHAGSRAPVCPAGTSYDSVAGDCSGSATCPAGFVNTGPKCEGYATGYCPSGYSYEAVFDSCVTCPTGTNFNPLAGNFCSAPPICPPGFAYIGPKCEGYGTGYCPSGYSYEAVFDSCVTCPAGRTSILQPATSAQRPPSVHPERPSRGRHVQTGPSRRAPPAQVRRSTRPTTIAVYPLPRRPTCARQERTTTVGGPASPYRPVQQARPSTRPTTCAAYRPRRLPICARRGHTTTAGGPASPYLLAPRGRASPLLRISASPGHLSHAS